MATCDIPMIDIELVRGCNLRCRWCSVKNKSQHRFMARELFERIINECSAKRIGYRRLSLFLGGEPLLHPEFLDFLAIMKEHAIDKLGYSIIQLFTNGITKPELYEDIVMSGVISLVRFSVDGLGDKRSYEYMRPPAEWETVVQNVKRMVELRNSYLSPMSVRLTTLIPHQSFVPFPVPAYDDAVKRMNNVFMPLGVDEIGYRRIGTLVGIPVGIPNDYYDHRRICYLVKDRKIVVNFDGSVSTCSSDLNGTQCLGHLHQGGIEAVWNSERFQEFLLRKTEGEKHPYGFCEGCDRNNV